jgi:hypothetical protein
MTGYHLGWIFMGVVSLCAAIAAVRAGPDDRHRRAHGRR